MAVTALLPEQSSRRQVEMMLNDCIRSKNDLELCFQLHAPAKIGVMAGKKVFVESADPIQNGFSKCKIGRAAERQEWMMKIDMLRKMTFSVQILTQMILAVDDRDLTGNATDLAIGKRFQ